MQSFLQYFNFHLKFNNLSAMQKIQNLQAETPLQFTGINYTPFPWAFIIYILPGVLFLPYGLERYQMLRNQPKKEHEQSLSTCHLFKWIIYLIMCLELTIWVYITEYPDKMNMDYSHLNLTVLYLLLLLSWNISSEIEVLELGLEKSHTKKVQNIFWASIFLTNLLQYFLSSDVHSYVRYVLLTKLGLNFIFFLRAIRKNYGSSGNPKVIHYFNSNDIPIVKVEFSNTLIKNSSLEESYSSISMTISIGDEYPYKIIRRMTDFLELSSQIKSEYTCRKFPLVSIKLPILDIELFNEYLFWEVEDHLIISLLSNYLVKLVNDCDFMSSFLLEFLAIPEKYHQIFEAHLSELEQIQERFIESTNFGKLTIDFEDFNFHKFDVEAVDLLNLDLLAELQITVNFITKKYSELLQETLFAFEIKIVLPQKKILESRILRLYMNFETLVTNMEEQLIRKIPRLSDAREITNEMLPLALDKYFRFLVSTKQYRCPHLIQFLGYDPTTFEPLDFKLFASDYIFFDLDN